MKTAIVVTIAGMILDILGAVILARSFVLKRPADVFRDLKSLGVWDFHITRGARDLLLSWLVQRLEARAGAAILGVGFLLQAVSQFLTPSSLPYGILALSAVGGLALAAFFVLQKWFVRVAAAQALAFYDHLETEATSKDWKREIPARHAELQRIRANPGPWLAGVEGIPPLDPTLTSN